MPNIFCQNRLLDFFHSSRLILILYCLHYKRRHTAVTYQNFVATIRRLHFSASLWHHTIKYFRLQVLSSHVHVLHKFPSHMLKWLAFSSISPRRLTKKAYDNSYNRIRHWMSIDTSSCKVLTTLRSSVFTILRFCRFVLVLFSLWSVSWISELTVRLYRVSVSPSLKLTSNTIEPFNRLSNVLCDQLSQIPHHCHYSLQYQLRWSP